MSTRLVGWAQRVRQFDVSTVHSRGALWTGLGAHRSRAIATARGLTTLELTPSGASLDRGPDKVHLDADFGATWGPEKKQVWAWLSVRFAQSLAGRVTLLLLSGELTKGLKAERARIDSKIVWDELMDVNVFDAVSRNPKVTGITVIEFDPSGIANFTYPMPLSRHPQ